jgi:hypothetical protein
MFSRKYIKNLTCRAIGVVTTGSVLGIIAGYGFNYYHDDDNIFKIPDFLLTKDRIISVISRDYLPGDKLYRYVHVDKINTKKDIARAFIKCNVRNRYSIIPKEYYGQLFKKEELDEQTIRFATDDEIKEFIQEVTKPNALHHGNFCALISHLPEKFWDAKQIKAETLHKIDPTISLHDCHGLVSENPTAIADYMINNKLQIEISMNRINGMTQGVLFGDDFNKLVKHYDEKFVKLVERCNQYNHFMRFDHDGLYNDHIPLNIRATCSEGGIYFIYNRPSDIWSWSREMDYHELYHVTVPDDALVAFESDKIKTNKIILNERTNVN